MWRKVIVGVVGLAVVGSAIVLAQGFQPRRPAESEGRQQRGPRDPGPGRERRGPRDPGPGRQQRGPAGQRQGGRQQQMQQLRRAVMNAPRAMTAHNGKLYMIKQGMLLKLGSDLNVQDSVRIPREAMIRPQLTADTNRIYLSGVRQLVVFNASNLSEVDTKALGDITPQLQEGQGGLTPGQQPGREGTGPAPEEGGSQRPSPEAREGLTPNLEQ